MMIRIFTSRKLLGNRKVINDPDSFFSAHVSHHQFDENNEKVIEEIDGAKLIDCNLGTIKTPLGLTDINHLSSGCKTVLDYLYITRNNDKLKDFALNVTICGYNALESLFVQMDRLNDSDTILLLQHTDSLQMCSDRQYMINDVHQTNHLSDIIGM